MQRTIIDTSNLAVKKININAVDSVRDYALNISNNSIINANPPGSIRSLNLDPFFNLSNVSVSQACYGSNLKLTVGTNANSASSHTSVIAAINCYSLINNPGGGTLAIANNRGISCNADVGANLPGVTVTNNTAVHVDAVASRGTTTIINAYGIYVTRPNHGVNRYGIYLEAVSGGTTAWSLYNAGNQYIGATNNSSSAITGALVVAGGVGVGNGLYVGGAITALGGIFVGSNGNNQNIALQGNIVQSTGNCNFRDVYTDYLKLPLSNAPATSSSTGTAGEIRIDSNFVYTCIATNNWKRAAISAW